MGIEDKKAKWIDEEGYLYPMQVFRGAGCVALGEDDVGLFIEYQKSAVDQSSQIVRVRLSAEHALQLAAQLRLYADQPRPPPPRSDKRTK